jgi:hypothetical protein
MLDHFFFARITRDMFISASTLMGIQAMDVETGIENEREKAQY